MQKIFQLKLLPSEAANEQAIKDNIAAQSGMKPGNISGFIIQKKSLDARGRQPWISLSVNAYINEPFQDRVPMKFSFPDVKKARHQVLIAGSGPAGLFAALKLIEMGIRPVILERGKESRNRRRDLALLNREGIVNPESNYCFGEGGAGTYSDGKLYTRSTKRGDVERILNLLVHFGAGDNILYEAHPHIGTNKLPAIISSIRKQVLDCGGIFQFEKKVNRLLITDHRLTGLGTADGDIYYGDAVILATGHSARDIFELLASNHIQIECKPFALGVRVEHPQHIIDCLQYHCEVPGKQPSRPAFLPPASYSLAGQVEERGVFSFCMCPGGIIAPAATAPGEIVVNGWSPSKRNNPFANSGMVVSVEEKDLVGYSKHGPLAGLYFQKSVEQKAFLAGGGKQEAPAQRLIDFIENKSSSSLPVCSYLPGITPAALKEVIPAFIHRRLQKGFIEFGKKMKGWLTNDAVVLATESRTSSPVRIPRNNETLEHPQVKGLYPCGEGAGYAGGIMSAAMDGEKVAGLIAKTLV